MQADPNTQETEHEGADPDVVSAPVAAAIPSLLDLSLRRGNPRQSQSAPSLWDARDMLRIPSPTLDAGVIRAHEQFEALEGYGCDLAIAAMEALQDVTRKVIAGREAVREAGLKAEAEQVLDTFDLHTKLAPHSHAQVGRCVAGAEPRDRAPRG